MCALISQRKMIKSTDGLKINILSCHLRLTSWHEVKKTHFMS